MASRLRVPYCHVQVLLLCRLGPIHCVIAVLSSRLIAARKICSSSAGWDAAFDHVPVTGYEGTVACRVLRGAADQTCDEVGEGFQHLRGVLLDPAENLHCVGVAAATGPGDADAGGGV